MFQATMNIIFQAKYSIFQAMYPKLQNNSRLSDIQTFKKVDQIRLSDFQTFESLKV